MYFENTETAYRSKSIEELKQALFLFRMIKNPLVSKIGIPLLRYAFKAHLPVGWIVKKFLYNHFIGGETLEQSIKTSKKLSQYKVKSVLDYATEGAKSEESIQSALYELLRNIEASAKSPDVPFAVFKPSAFANFEFMERVCEGKALSNLDEARYNEMKKLYDKVFAHADKCGIPVMVDAEETWIQPLIDEVVNEGMEKYNKGKVVVVNTYQMYRTDRLAIIREMYRRAEEKDFMLGVKIVRGAYMEKERKRAKKLGYTSPIHANKDATDHDFDEAMLFCMENRHRIVLFAGTHNEISCQKGVDFMKKHNIPSDHPHIWFSQLYGMCDHITFNMGEMGYNVIKYTPYGKVNIVSPYLLRRAEENSSVGSQAMKELKLIREELKRRGNK